MRVYENQCVGCPPEIGCLGRACPYINVPVDYCDECDNGIAIYEIDGRKLCEDCAHSFLQELFDELYIEQKAQLLNIDLYELNT